MVARAELCLQLAASRPIPRPTIGQAVRLGDGLEGTLVRHYAPRDKRLPLRALVRIAGGRDRWCNDSAITLAETEAQRDTRIQEAASSMLCSWDKSMPGTLRTYGEYYAEQAARL